MWILILTLIASIAQGARPLKRTGTKTQVGGHKSGKVACNDEVIGTTTKDNKVMVYEFTAKKVNYIFDGCRNEFDSIFELFDDKGNWVAENDDHGEWDCIQQNTPASYMKAKLTPGKKYKFQIAGINNEFDGGYGNYYVEIWCPSSTEARVGDHTNAAAGYEVIGQVNDAITFFAIIGVLSVIYFGGKAAYGKVCQSDGFTRIDAEAEC